MTACHRVRHEAVAVLGAVVAVAVVVAVVPVVIVALVVGDQRNAGYQCMCAEDTPRAYRIWIGVPIATCYR